MKILILLALVAATQAVSLRQLAKDEWDLYKVRNIKIKIVAFFDNHQALQSYTNSLIHLQCDDIPSDLEEISPPSLLLK